MLVFTHMGINMHAWRHMPHSHTHTHTHTHTHRDIQKQRDKDRETEKQRKTLHFLFDSYKHPT